MPSRAADLKRRDLFETPSGQPAARSKLRRAASLLDDGGSSATLVRPSGDGVSVSSVVNRLRPAEKAGPAASLFLGPGTEYRRG